MVSLWTNCLRFLMCQLKMTAPSVPSPCEDKCMQKAERVSQSVRLPSYFLQLYHETFHCIIVIQRPTCSQWNRLCFCLNNLFICLCQVLITAHRLFNYGMWTLSCGIWDLVPWLAQGWNLDPLHWGTPSLSHWTTKEVPRHLYFDSNSFPLLCFSLVTKLSNPSVLRHWQSSPCHFTWFLLSLSYV